MQKLDIDQPGRNGSDPPGDKLSNLFLTGQGAKLDPINCASSTDVTVFEEVIDLPVAGANVKGDLLELAAFEFEVRFDEKLVCVNIAPGTAAANMICIILDKHSSGVQGWASIACATKKGEPFPDTNTAIGRQLAVITVRPQPELYSQIIANQDNGIVLQLLNQGCNLADQDGHPIPILSCEDADVTVRYLEGDVNADCSVDDADQQIMAFVYGAEKGSLLYNRRFDMDGDGDIDIKDLQFVFGRQTSSCDAPNPKQPPANPKGIPCVVCPTPTPMPATSTPIPTNTPMPATSTPIPTNTPMPTPTSTLSPSATPTPTPTPTVTATVTATAMPTSTPCPPEGCPTATPPPTPTPTEASIALSIGIPGVCDTLSGNAKCDLAADASFTLDIDVVDVQSIPVLAGGYNGVQMVIFWEGAVEGPKPGNANTLTNTSTDPSCAIRIVELETGARVDHAAVSCNGFSPLTMGTAGFKNANLGQAEFDCVSPGVGTITLLHGEATGDSFVLDLSLHSHEEKNPSDVLTVNCVAPDVDSDGCSDIAELQTAPGSQMTGGLRDPSKFWDFLDQWVNQEKDRVVNIIDIGAIVQRLGATGDPGGDPLNPPQALTGYHVSADRSSPEPDTNLWNAGPPDGNINIIEISLAAVQFGHNCSGLP
jgi:hypothetical protein